MGKKINTKMFLQFLLDQAKMADSYEAEAKEANKYEDALRLREERLTYEYIYNICTGENETDIAEFMEDAEDNEN